MSKIVEGKLVGQIIKDTLRSKYKSPWVSARLRQEMMQKVWPRCKMVSSYTISGQKKVVYGNAMLNFASNFKANGVGPDRFSSFNCQLFPDELIEFAVFQFISVSEINLEIIEKLIRESGFIVSTIAQALFWDLDRQVSPIVVLGDNSDICAALIYFEERLPALPGHHPAFVDWHISVSEKNRNKIWPQNLKFLAYRVL